MEKSAKQLSQELLEGRTGGTKYLIHKFEDC